MSSKNNIVKNNKPLRQQTKRVKNFKDPMGKFQWKRAGKTSAVWILIIIFAIVFSTLVYHYVYRQIVFLNANERHPKYRRETHYRK